MNPADIRDGIRTRLATVSGLRTFDIVPDSVEPPVAVVQMRYPVQFDSAMGHGLHRYGWTIRVLVSRASERAGQDKLDTYLATSGPTSVRAAFDVDRTLGGAVADLHVTEVTDGGRVEVGGIEYFGADFALDTYGP